MSADPDSNHSTGELLAALRASERPRLVLRPDPEPPAPRAVALLAGSFDPLTVAHVSLARAALERVGLVVLSYSTGTLPKEVAGPPRLLTESERVAALERFAEREPQMTVGLTSHGLLADQVTAARERFPGVRLYVVAGSDKVRQVLAGDWYEDREATLTRLFGEAEFLYADRAGEEGAVESALALPENVVWRARFHRLKVPPSIAAVSSRLVREQLRLGNDVRLMVPEVIHDLLGIRE